ncbi:L-aspartate oxidase [Endozoicomonadaceae bacterium StTr2]
MTKAHIFDVLVIGSGAAGLSLALELGPDTRVAVLSKAELSAGSTYWAQGGIAAVLSQDDSTAEHVEDTLTAGAGLCNEDTVRFTVENSKAGIDWLTNHGVPFTREQDTDDYHLTREGGHSQRRVIHAADATGQALSNTLQERVRQAENITVFEHHMAINLITSGNPPHRDYHCKGAYVFDTRNEAVEQFLARSVVLASGGASKAYLYTSNVDGASGDGIAMAWRAGCRVANLEFNQFHPTCLYHPHAKASLISEAVRGEGGLLVRADGSRFMPEYHPLAELAPRDIVARAIDHEMKRSGADCVYLDISHKPEEFIREHFPTINQTCQRFGIDMTKEPIPVVPAAHYTCGGVMVDHNGQTDVPGLYAIGEASHTGLHGANRLASNSLLECIVFAHSAARDIEERLHTIPNPEPVADWDASQVTDSNENVVISHNWDELRRFMWDYVGIVRTTKRLLRARNRVMLLMQEIDDFYRNFRISSDLIELRNLALTASLMIRCALERKESRGLHFTLDYPETAKQAEDTVLSPFVTGANPLERINVQEILH